VEINVLPPPQPVVKITNPHDGATIHRAPVNVHVCAFEKHFTNAVVNVEFFAGGNSIGTSTNAPFSCIIWDQAQPGSYSLTAVATDSSGATFTSPPISVNVVTNGARHHQGD
jgi:hypothetical protein